MMTTNMIVEIQQDTEKKRAGIRKLPGTVLQNQTTGEVIYTPPSSEQEILDSCQTWKDISMMIMIRLTR